MTFPTNTPSLSEQDRRWCPECADERPFEMPPCEDGHGVDCLDLACVDCGFGIVVGVVVEDDVLLVEFAAA
jgi:hypothetical protein